MLLERSEDAKDYWTVVVWDVTDVKDCCEIRPFLIFPHEVSK